MDQSRQERPLPAWPGMGTLIAALDETIRDPTSGSPVLLAIEEAPEGSAGADFLEGLKARCAAERGHLAPCAFLRLSTSMPGDEQPVAILVHGLRTTMPPNTGRLRLPTLDLLLPTVEAEELRGVPRDRRGRELRRVLLHRRRRDSRFLEVFNGEAEAAGGTLPARLLRLAVRVWTAGVGEWWFGARVRWGRVGRGGWFERWTQGRIGGRRPDFFDAAARLAPGAPEPLDRDQALLGALFDDLEKALKRRFLRPAHSRRPGFVLLIDAVPQGPDGPTVERMGNFLAALRQGMKECAEAGVVVVVRVSPEVRHRAGFSPDLLEPNDAAVPAALRRRKDAGADDRESPGASGPRNELVIRVPEPGAPHDREAEIFLANRPKLTAPPGSRLGPRTALLLQVGALLAVPALLVGGWAVAELHGDGDGPCPEGQWEATGGLSCLGLSDGTEPFRGVSEEFGPLIELIAENNARAEEYGERGWQMRTVVHLAPYTAAMPGPGAVQDSTLAELHGIALAQRMLLEEVGRDAARDRVALRVLLANAGARFSEGPRVAGAILEEVDAEGIIGVTGLGQSREDTYRTMDVLDAAGLPMIGTTATADGMLERGAQQYFQLAPTNDRQARVAISFLAHTPLLPPSEVETEPEDATEGSDADSDADPDDGVGPGADGDPAAGDPATVPADAAIIVYDELDIYSENLAEAFRTHFHEEIGDRITDVRYRPREGVHGEAEGAYSPDALRSLGEVAEHVCRHMAPERSTVVLWAGREGDLVGFLDDFSRVDGCDSRLTVLGGDAVANALVGEVNPVAKHSGLTLYYLVHAIPGTDPRTERARLFNRTLDAWAEERRRRGDAPPPATGEVLESGGAALGWDAMDILATAAGLAHRTEGRTGDFDRSAVSTVLNTGNVNIQGATGLLTFRERRVPVEKPVYVVRATGEGTEIVLSCGRFSAGVEDTAWGPDEVPCPRDD
ncbi:hypothetical protein GCM10027160_32120 [Streptomyces calidiresistens]|uniref:Uncharacterized protein n=1 Tax=Streptomyces calidiresistens TaxID=1485586 RepID=A0A7W3XVG3_9ACTN|nr:hypothetical protein [Streptomyces calidiresistens]MBB0228935.1 hypothetical protein [Streptomyces calidiresistens]